MSTKNSKNTKNQNLTELLCPQEIAHRSPDDLKPYPGNARIHNERQITALTEAIREFGFQGVIIINEEDVILSGHGRVEAAKRLKLPTVPTIRATGLTKAQQRAFVIADNKLAQLSKWDMDILQQEVELLLEEDFHIETTGFSTAEIDLLIDETIASEHVGDPDELRPEDMPEEIVARSGDVWQLGDHRLYCGSSLEEESFKRLMKGEKAELIVTDPPYNVPINGHVCGSGKTKHEEFAMAAGEMTATEFTEFLKAAFVHAQNSMQNGAVCFSFMDWRHMREIMDAGESVFGQMLQLCVWAKDNGGMGTFYRSQHELVFVFKNGKAKHINNFELGQHGRYRTNVWNYPGANTFTGKGYDLLKMHPTVKPVGMIADVLRDCSTRNGIVLDPFAGSGTIFLAAERTGRRAYGIELDPKYVDVAIKRWERVTGKKAINLNSSAGYNEPQILRFDEEQEYAG